MFVEILNVVPLDDRYLVHFGTEYGAAWGFWRTGRPGKGTRYDVEFNEPGTHSWGDTIAVAGDGSYRVGEEGDLVCFSGVLEMFQKAMPEAPEDVDHAILRIGDSIFMAATQGKPPPIGTPVVVKVAYWDLELYDTGVL